MKLKSFLCYFLMAGVLSLSPTANAQFDFGGPFDFFNDDDDYNSYRNGSRRGYGRERWRGYDEWEPNYWRYRFFDDDSDDYIFDQFDGGDFFGDGRGRGRFNFDMNMDTDFDGGYENDYRNRGNQGDRYDRRDGRYGDDRSARREPYRGGSRQNDDRYDDDYWRDYSQHYNDNNRRRMSQTPEYERRRTEQDYNKPVECR